MPKIRFKLQTDTDPDERERVLESLLSEGACEVQPMFEGERDADLASLFVADCEDDRAADSLLEFLRRSPSVEFGEPDVKRKLIR